MGAVTNRLNLPLPMVKNHLKVDYDYDDALIQDYVESAKQEADDFLNNNFERTTERLGRGDGSAVVFNFGYSPVLLVKAVKVNSCIVGTSSYTVDKANGTLTFTTAPDDGYPVDVTYEAELPIPEIVRTWVLNRVAFKYEHRTDNVAQQTDGAGSVTWKPDDFTNSPLWRLRRNPGF